MQSGDKHIPGDKRISGNKIIPENKYAAEMKGPQKRKTVWEAACFFLLFLFIWTLWIILKRRWNSTDIVEGIFGWGDVIWIGWGAVLVCWNRKQLNILPREMFLTAPKWRRLLPMLLFVALYYVGVMFNSYGRLYSKPGVHILTLILTFLIVGFQEELVFRGYFLNRLSVALTERRANLLSALFFLLIHVPGWLRRGMPAASMVETGAGVFLLGLFFGYAFRKDRCLWSAVLLHMVWDVFSGIV